MARYDIPDYASPKVLEKFLNNFRVQIINHNYDSSIAKKVTFHEILSDKFGNIIIIIIHLQPYLDSLMEEFRDFFFANASTTFERGDRRLMIQSDLMFTYWIEKLVRKLVAISDKNIFWHEYSVNAMLNDPDPSPLPGAGHSDDLCYFFR